MAEVTGLRNNALPYPVYGAPWGVVFPMLDADGDLVTGATTPDAERSLNGDTFADCSNESTEIATASGVYYLLLTAAEMTADVVAVIAKSATAGMKTTVLTFYPRKLVTLRSGTVGANAADGTTIQLDSGASAIDDYYNGCLIVATIDTVVEARIISDYVGSTKVCSITPAFVTAAPDNNDTFVVYQPEGRQVEQSDVAAFGGVTGTFSAGRPEVNTTHAAGTAWNSGAIGATTLATDTITNAKIAADAIGAAEIADGAIDAATFAANAITSTVIANDAITAAKIADGAIDAATFATGAITATAIAADAIGASELAADAVAEIADAVWDEDATGHQTGGTFGQAIGDPGADTTTIYQSVVTDAAGTNVAIDIIAVKAQTAAIETDTAEIGAAGAGLTNINLPNQTMDIVGNITGNLSGSVGSVTGAVGSVTGNVGGSVGSVATGGITAASIADGAIDRATFAADTGLLTIRSNTAQAGAATTITLDASASAVDDFYNFDIIYLTGGTGAGQARFISDYVGSTKVATVPTWATNPDNTTTFAILPFGSIPGATAPTAAEVADAVWDEDATGHQTQGTFGQAIGDPVADTNTIFKAVVTDATGATVGVDVAAVLDDTGTAGVVVASINNNAITANAIASDAITAAKIADGAIDAATFATGAITATAIAADAIGASELAADAVAEIADAVWDEDATGHQTTGTFGQAIGDPAANTATIYAAVVTNAAGTDVAADIIAIKAETASILTDTAEIGVAGAGLTNINLPNQTMDIVGNITGNLSGSVGSVTGAVGSVTGNVGGNVSGSVGSVASGGITATSIAADAIGASELAADAVAEIADAVWDEVTSGHAAAGTFGQALFITRANTAQAGASTTITLDASASATDDIYNDHVITITAGTGAVQARIITDYVGSTKVATVDPAWDVTPSSDSVFIITPMFPTSAGGGGATAAEIADAVWDEAQSGHTTAGTFGQQSYIIRANTAQAGASTTITLDASASATDDFYNSTMITITGGTGAGQTRIISDYVGSTKVATVPAWVTNPDNTSVFIITPFGAIPGATAPTAAEVADAVWDEDATAHQTQGTFGQVLGDSGADADSIWSLANTNLNATVSSRASQTSVDDLPTNAELATALGTADDAVLTAINDLPTNAELATALGTADDAVLTAINDLPTNAELATALGTADDAVLAAIAALNNLSQANIRTAVGLASANLDTQLADLPTNAELATALGTADDAVLAQVALVKAKTDSLTFTVAGKIDSNPTAINGDATSAANLAKTTRAIGRGTVTTGASTTSIPTSAFTPTGAAADQFKGRIITFDADTTTASLRGQSTDITASTNAASPTFTVTALTTAPSSGDTFSVT